MRYKRGMISPFSIFAMFFVCRVLSIFGINSVVFLGNYSSDLLISIGLGLVIALALSVPIVYASAKHRELIKPKWLSVIYGIYFLFLGAVSVGRFSAYASMELNVESQPLFHAFLIILACSYAAWLGIEPISRFGAFILSVTIIGIVGIVGFGLREFSLLNLFPFTRNSTNDILMNAVGFACETNEIILLVVLAPKVNGKIVKPFYSAVILAFVACGLLMFYSLAVLGDTAKVVSFPFYNLSQISKLSNIRLDSVYTAFWIFAVFLKGALFLYCAAECFPFRKRGLSCACLGVGIFAIIWAISELGFFLHRQSAAIVTSFVLFSFVIPLLRLVFSKKSKGEILIERL